jgi:hypothetical protein
MERGAQVAVGLGRWKAGGGGEAGSLWLQAAVGLLPFFGPGRASPRAQRSAQARPELRARLARACMSSGRAGPKSRAMGWAIVPRAAWKSLELYMLIMFKRR